MKGIAFTVKAENDIFESTSWYEAQKIGLGEDFLEGLEKLVYSIRKNPLMFPVTHKNIRKAIFNKFPFAVFYIIDKDKIIVIAVMHQFRNPLVWRKRS